MTHCQSPSLRAWQALMDKLIGMNVEAVPGQEHIFRFSGTDRLPVTLRIKKELYGCCCTDGLYKIVELLDESGRVLITEKWFENFSLFAKNKGHVLDELFDLIKTTGPSGLSRLQGIRAVQEAAAN